MEVFKTIEIATNYEVSNLGRIRNKKTGRILKQSFVTKGYLSTCITMNKYNRGISVKVHRIVAETFIGNKIGHVIDHHDNDKANNNINNLSYVTNRYNIVKQKLNSKNGFIRKNNKQKNITYTTEYRKDNKKFNFTATTEIECVIHYCKEMTTIDESVVSLLEKHYNFKLNN